ncbi:MFS transporter [Ornithinibacillus halotolerans]|uniref:Transporter YwbF n=1 Tax=Ornithinibacillus halotolerans TaxID=1274357 RepID=A0A916RXG5_9BACI|nr:MFS transporter [Ornithinibacillus halotolerans]GGA75757.1 putative transporter YwbF [Ornithinibacillus halotolerans]
MANHESLVPLKMLLFSFHATNTIILSFLPLYLEYKELSETEIGWVLAIGPLASIFAQPFWGYMSDKFKTVKYVLLVCVIGLLIFSTIFFQMNGLIAIMLMGAVFYFFTTPIGGLGDSLAQRRADEVGISFGSIRTWGSVGFAISSLVIGGILTKYGVQYMIWPYLLFGFIALLVVLRIKDVKVESDPVKLKDVGILMKNKSFLFFLLAIIFLSVTHRTNDSFIGLYISELGGSAGLVGLGWFVGVMTEAIVFATAGLWYRKFHPLIFVMGAGILYSIRWFIYGTATDPMFIIGLQFLHGLTFGVFYLAALDFVTRLIPNILQSTGHLVYYAVFFGISGIIGSLGGGAIMDHFNGGTLYHLLGFVSLIGTAAILIYHVMFSRNRAVSQ